MARSRRVSSLFSSWAPGRRRSNSNSNSNSRHDSDSASPPELASPAPIRTAAHPDSPASAPADLISPPSAFGSPAPFNRSSAPPNAYAGVNYERASPNSHQRTRSNSRTNSRPLSMVQTYHPPVMEVEKDTPPELQPIFTFLNSHANKLYQEGYFLLLHDLDSRGRPSGDRSWKECFAQLVGTVLSLWDAEALDAAGDNAEVVPTFINISDASIKMIESLPMNSAAGQELQHVLSVSTAANNRYLLHFNSLNSLTQWTAGIRLAMFENSSLQEAYTGSLIAGKGKSLNNIRQIMERTRMKQEDWVRVRFGAGTPWRRCWCVISPPDEKEYQKMQKAAKKKTYGKPPVLKGDVKFYEHRKVTKKSFPIATITDAYAAYAIYPQSKALIDQSTLMKVEGQITIHTNPESKMEGFVFLMPEHHAAVCGFEMLLRFLFPVWDVFNLYGRPTRLVADVLDQRGLMFALPKDKRYGYLDILDVASLVHADGSKTWTERDWRKQMKDLTNKRMLAGRSPVGSRRGSTHRDSRSSLPPVSKTGGIRFQDDVSASTPASGRVSPIGRGSMDTSSRSGTTLVSRERSASEAPNYRNGSSLAMGDGQADPYGEMGGSPPPPPPMHRQGVQNGPPGQAFGSPPNAGFGGDRYAHPGDTSPGSDGSGGRPSEIPEELAARGGHGAPAPVMAPPQFQHKPTQRPSAQRFPGEDLRRQNSAPDGVVPGALAAGSLAAAGAASAWNNDRRVNGAYPPAGRRSLDETEPFGRPPQSPTQYQPPRAAWNANPYPQHPQPPPQGRLPTIPASPYVPQTGSPTAQAHSKEYFVSNVGAPQPPAVPEHGAAVQSTHLPPQPRSPGTFAPDARFNSPMPTEGTAHVGDAASVGSTSPQSKRTSLRRKPLPADAHVEHFSHSARAPGSRGTDGGESTSTTDYHTESSAGKNSFEAPRAGKLRTVGNVEPQDIRVGDAKYAPGNAVHDMSSDLPSVDFGPTYTYRPKPPGMFDGNRMSQNPTVTAQVVREYLPPSEPSRSHHRSDSKPSLSGDDSSRHSAHWTPGLAAAPGQSHSGHALSAEEWVRQRGEAAKGGPMYHIRNKSSTNVLGKPTSRPGSSASGRPGTGSGGRATPEDHLVMRAAAGSREGMRSRENLLLHNRSRSSLSLGMTGGSSPSPGGSPGMTAGGGGGLVNVIAEREQERAHAAAERGRMMQTAMAAASPMPSPGSMGPRPGAMSPSGPYHREPGMHPPSGPHGPRPSPTSYPSSGYYAQGSGGGPHPSYSRPGPPHMMGADQAYGMYRSSSRQGHAPPGVATRPGYARTPSGGAGRVSPMSPGFDPMSSGMPGMALGSPPRDGNAIRTLQQQVQMAPQPYGSSYLSQQGPQGPRAPPPGSVQREGGWM